MFSVFLMYKGLAFICLMAEYAPKHLETATLSQWTLNMWESILFHDIYSLPLVSCVFSTLLALPRNSRFCTLQRNSQEGALVAYFWENSLISAFKNTRVHGNYFYSLRAIRMKKKLSWVCQDCLFVSLATPVASVNWAMSFSSHICRALCWPTVRMSSGQLGAII